MSEESKGAEVAAEQSGEGVGDGQSPVERMIQSDDRTYHQQMGPAASYPSPPLSRQDGEMWPILLSAGVGLPFVSIVIELLTRICAEGYLNPLPTPWHIFIVCFVPFTNFLLWNMLRSPDLRYPKYLGIAHGFSIGIAAFYTILFLPILPIALLMLTIGLGLLGMAPLFALIAGVFSAVKLRHILRTLCLPGDPTPRLHGIGWGITLSLLSLIVPEVPLIITRIGLEMATSESISTELRGIRLLRDYGSEKILLRACYQGDYRSSDILSNLFTAASPVTTDQARQIYYRVSGRTFDSEPAPSRLSSAFSDIGKLLDIDRTQNTANGVLQNLLLASSQMDGSIDADGAHGYLEWTIIFKNYARRQEEARAQILLPPGGVVSRLTLWINGEEREAAFAERTRVEAAYTAVVSQRRDPVLVTSSGVNRIDVRCFPVPPNGEMKIRIGITAPLHLESKERAWMRLPGFLEHNFVIEPEKIHSVWIEGNQRLDGSHKNLRPEQPKPDLYALRGLLSHAEMANSYPSILTHRSENVTQMWTTDHKTGAVIRQRLEERELSGVRRAAFVIDGSVGMKRHLSSIADALKKLPEQIEFSVLVASDEVVELAAPQRATASSTADVGERLKRTIVAGGQDNLPALLRAWEIASQSPESVIVWVHDPHPIKPRGVQELRQRFYRRPDSPQLLDIQAKNGPNFVLEQLDGISSIRSTVRIGNPVEDLERLFHSWRAGTKQIVPVREKIPRQTIPTGGNVKETSSHLARLWAFDEVNRLLASNTTDSSTQAVKLAANYQLVTPVTGAVVLETKEQYDQARLKPAERGTVPTIPEPEEWLLMIVVATILIWTLFRRRIMWAW
jgi:Vault protein inter-alpha-trypsin domain